MTSTQLLALILIIDTIATGIAIINISLWLKRLQNRQDNAMKIIGKLITMKLDEEAKKNADSARD